MSVLGHRFNHGLRMGQARASMSSRQLVYVFSNHTAFMCHVTEDAKAHFEAFVIDYEINVMYVVTVF